MEEGVSVVNGDPFSAETLQGANIGEEVSVVDTDDSESVSVALAVTETNPGVHTVALTRDTDLSRYLEYAGADTVLSRHLLVRRIAERIESEVVPSMTESVSVGGGFGVVEMEVPSALRALRKAAYSIGKTRRDLRSAKETDSCVSVPRYRR